MSIRNFLDGLPPEILQNIVQHVDEMYPPSVQAFAGVNAASYSAATPLLFRTIRISADFHLIYRAGSGTIGVLSRDMHEFISIDMTVGEIAMKAMNTVCPKATLNVCFGPTSHSGKPHGEGVRGFGRKQFRLSGSRMADQCMTMLGSQAQVNHPSQPSAYLENPYVHMV